VAVASAATVAASSPSPRTCPVGVPACLPEATPWRAAARLASLFFRILIRCLALATSAVYEFSAVAIATQQRCRLLSQGYAEVVMATKQLGLSLCARQNAATCATNVSCFNVVFTDHTAFQFTLRDRDQARNRKKTQDEHSTCAARMQGTRGRNATVVNKT